MDIYIVSKATGTAGLCMFMSGQLLPPPFAMVFFPLEETLLSGVEISHGHKSVAILALMLINGTALSANNRDKSKWSKTFYKRCCTFK